MHTDRMQAFQCLRNPETSCLCNLRETPEENEDLGTSADLHHEEIQGWGPLNGPLNGGDLPSAMKNGGNRGSLADDLRNARPQHTNNSSGSRAGERIPKSGRVSLSDPGTLSRKSSTKALSQYSRSSGTPSSGTPSANSAPASSVTSNEPLLSSIKQLSGLEAWARRPEYEGGYLNKQMHGPGVLRLASGAFYQGQFKSDELEGEGTYTFADGRVYRGQWKMSQMHGFGAMEWQDGSTHEGFYAGNERSGEGTFSWVDGRVYSGQWLRGKQHGAGTMVDSRGRMLSGNWAEGEYKGPK